MRKMVGWGRKSLCNKLRPAERGHLRRRCHPSLRSSFFIFLLSLWQLFRWNQNDWSGRQAGLTLHTMSYYHDINSHRICQWFISQPFRLWMWLLRTPTHATHHRLARETIRVSALQPPVPCLPLPNINKNPFLLFPLSPCPPAWSTTHHRWVAFMTSQRIFDSSHRGCRDCASDGVPREAQKQPNGLKDILFIKMCTGWCAVPMSACKTERGER